ncbi:response regulator transcription factor [Pseudothermotoga thermarum]|uniref:Two component transcriptional regulator, winged helix family n=1 Tax=Pseudothermotoga thermarum DSM 5069 TaxID=688269 RepID=F7YTP7_9THEM|nr:response regulator transcription factor [Pseudothermotoga thermarum]AEH51269.1 two component transcriptional regulator, winged helix family [Pseudothermotoga thermarum DSM 5069]
MRILIVEDNEDLLKTVKKFLEKEGYVVDTATDGDEGLDKAFENRYDCIVLDIMLPGIDGFEFVKALRESGIEVPVLMLTALDAVEDKVKGLSLGADDYLTKPFDLRELSARIASLIRRSQMVKGEELKFKDLKINTKAKSVRIKDVELKLSKREYELLEFFLRNPNVVFTREEILEKVWQNERYIRSNVVDVYISYLRNKLRDFGYDKYIETVPTLGYRFRWEERL